MNNNQENPVPHVTVLSARNSLINYFLDNDNIRYIDLFKFVQDSRQDKDSIISTYLIALQDLVTENVIALNVLSNPADINTLRWSLRAPIFLREQTIRLSGITAMRIASIVNSISEEEGCDMLAITDNDISEVLDFCNHLSSEMEEKDLINEQNLAEPPNKKKK